LKNNFLRFAPFLALMSWVPAMGASYLDGYCTQYVKSGQLGENDVEKLVSTLKKSQDSDARAQAADTLSCLGHKALPGIPAMITWFRDPSGEGRLNMIEAVAHLGIVAVPALTEALRSKDKDIRRGACMALGSIGPKAAPALDTLKQLLHEPGYDVALEADRAIKRITGSR
jgi:HEAT repeat protein